MEWENIVFAGSIAHQPTSYESTLLEKNIGFSALYTFSFHGFVVNRAIQA